MLLTPSGKVLVALSGGSDSTALLLKLLDVISSPFLFAATVDHGLRPEARDEAQQVGRLCVDLAVPHAILPWRAAGKRNAQSARLARYALLARHARDIGAKYIALGHTMDDQAETVFMRALRSRLHSGTIGLAGMTPHTAYDELTLWRPLLGQRRETLRAMLRERGIAWIDDPSNEALDQERVRVRKHLQQKGNELIENTARLASLTQRDRLWLSERAAEVIRKRVRIDADGALVLANSSALPRRLLREVFSLLIMTSGGTSHRPATTKFKDCVDCFMQGGRLVKTVGRALISVTPTETRFERESRHRQEGKTPLIVPFQQFRSACDFPAFSVLNALMDDLPTPARST